MSSVSLNQLIIPKADPRMTGVCSQLFFRQSFLNDVLTCPKMAYFRWILSIEESDSFLAAVMGTAGHAVISHMHSQKNFSMQQLSIMELFEKEFTLEMKRLKKLPKLSPKYLSYKDYFLQHIEEYQSMLEGYQRHPKNKAFNAVVNEGRFALTVPSRNPELPPYLFTGQIDQAGYYSDGTFGLRDIKFRLDDFRPSPQKFNLDLQMTLYAAALAYGKPACNECTPRYLEDPLTGQKTTIYNGPCSSCESKIGTNAWPGKLPERCELIWMRDFQIRKKDQYVRFKKDPSLPKVPLGKGGRLIQQTVENPQWRTGYKAGDQKGPGFIYTSRTQGHIIEHMGDILNICDSVRRAEFHRSPGSHCSFWCKHVETCGADHSIAIDKFSNDQLARYASDNPFDE